jgi:ferredoxin
METAERIIIEREIGEETKRGGIERRDFLKGAAIGAMGMGMLSSLLGCDNEANAEDSPNGSASTVDRSRAPVVGASELTGWTGTPAAIAALGGSTMPLKDINRCRQDYLDTQTDYTCEDGTVIPAIFVKVRALIHTYGMGCGNTPLDSSFRSITEKFTEDDAQAFLDMPMGEKFTAIDLYEKTGRPLDECVTLCEKIADAGYLCRFTTNAGISYHQVPFFQGVVEYHLGDVMADPTYNCGIMGADMLPGDMSTTGSPTFYAIPCDKSVVSDGTVLPFDDIEQLFKGKKKLAIAPCYCRYTAMARAGHEGFPTFEDFATGKFEDFLSPVNNYRVETCLMVGDEAEYWMYRGWAREITEDQALAYMRRSRDDGFILQSCFSKDTGTICSCGTDCGCGIIGEWLTLGSAEAIGASQPYGQISHYDLDVDFDSCIKCGMCAVRCPLHCVTMDGDGGYPQVNDMCFRCGQCAYTCPQKARKLVLRSEEDILELPRDFLDDNNMKAGYRFEHGLIF